MRKTLGLAALAAALACGGAYAQQVTVKVGVLSDMSSLYSDIGGAGSVAAAKLAIADFTKDNPNVKVELISGDHQNKPDIGSQTRQPMVRRRQGGSDHRYAELRCGAGGEPDHRHQEQAVHCLRRGGLRSHRSQSATPTPSTGPMTPGCWPMAPAPRLVKTGGDTWFFLTSDYAFGHALERDTMAAVENAGGKVLGKVRHPLNTNDFSSFLLQAQSSKAKVIGLANAGGDTINSIKQGAEFGIVKGGQKFAGLLVFASDVNALGLQTAQGLTLTETWYWDMNDANRAWTKRWQAERGAAGKFPTMVQAGVYSGLTHYLEGCGRLKERSRWQGGGRRR